MKKSRLYNDVASGDVADGSVDYYECDWVDPVENEERAESARGIGLICGASGCGCAAKEVPCEQKLAVASVEDVLRAAQSKEATQEGSGFQGFVFATQALTDAPAKAAISPQHTRTVKAILAENQTLDETVADEVFRVKALLQQALDSEPETVQEADRKKESAKAHQQGKTVVPEGSDCGCFRDGMLQTTARIPKLPQEDAVQMENSTVENRPLQQDDAGYEIVES